MLTHKHPTDLVNPYIGSISHMLVRSTVPEVMLPYGVARSTPQFYDDSDYYCNENVKGFPIGSALVMPGKDGDFNNTRDHNREDFRCYYCKLELEENEITAESTVTHHVYLHRFTGANELRILFPEGASAELSDGGLRLTLHQSREEQSITEYVLFRLAGAEDKLPVKEFTDKQLILSVSEKCVCMGSVSYISFEKAEESIRLEVGENSFDQLSANLQDVWDELLGRVTISGNSTDRQTVFYTALFRSFQRMTDYGEHGQYYSAYDHQVHSGDYFYTGDGLWDTFRCMHPLQLLLDTARQKDIVESYNLMYRQSGRMPCFPGIMGDLPVMIGFHAAALFADSLAKGLDVDYETAYEGIRKNAMEETMIPWRCGHPLTELDRCYHEKGFFPALAPGEAETEPLVHPDWEKRQSVAVTLEHAYDDWCAAQLAKHLGHEEDYELFLRRGQNYRNLFQAKTGFMSPKDKDGNWIEGFDPKFSGGMGGRDYTTENNTWTYTWSVFHDPEGLGSLFGGNEAAARALDRLFCEGFHPGEKSKFLYLGQFPDSTGLTGQFSMGNEPSFHIPYLYDYWGCAWKAQKRLRALMDIWFTNSCTGICGDEDGGAMSSWLTFSAMGFYPVCPGKDEYAIGTPLFDKCAITLQNGNTFTIKSKGAGDGLCYIQEAVLNGKKLSRPFLRHAEILAGGELVLKMGDRPNKNW